MGLAPSHCGYVDCRSRRPCLVSPSNVIRVSLYRFLNSDHFPLTLNNGTVAACNKSIREERD